MTVACVDAKARFDEYDQRVPKVDADTTDAPMVDTLPNIDGVWLLAVDPKPIAAGAFIQMAVTWDITSAGPSGTLDGSYQPLMTFGLAPDSPSRTSVGVPLVANSVPVDSTASFTATLTGTLPGPANSVSGTEYQVAINLIGTIRSTTLVCGTVTGSVGPIADVSGSTFAAVPTGSPLPAPVGECPPATAVDAGVDAP
ncbi:MAG: hypothetical protein R3B06_00090 [Kofleriaceae bacterium]